MTMMHKSVVHKIFMPKILRNCVVLFQTWLKSALIGAQYRSHQLVLPLQMDLDGQSTLRKHDSIYIPVLRPKIVKMADESRSALLLGCSVTLIILSLVSLRHSSEQHGIYLQAHQLGSYTFYVGLVLSILMPCSPMFLSILPDSIAVVHNGMGRHSATVSWSQLVFLLKVHLIQCRLSSMILTSITVHLCWQHSLPSHYQHDQDLHLTLLLPSLREAPAVQEANIHHTSSRCRVAHRFTHPRNTPMPTN